MKTPRELLLNQSRDATPALDRIRQRAVARLELQPPAAEEPSAWRALVQLGRWHWAGLGAAWLLVLLLQAAVPSDPTPALAETPPPPADLMLALREHQRQVRHWTDPDPVAETRPAPGRQSRNDIEIYNV